MSDGDTPHKPIFHASDARVPLSFGKRDNKNHQASAVALKTLHKLDHRGISAQTFGACLASFFYLSTYPLREKMDMSSVSQEELTSYPHYLF